MADNSVSNGNKRAGLLARVSSPNQRDNTSPESQLKRCRAYCEKRDYLVVDEQVEVISGKFVLARSKFNKYLEMGADGLLDVIVVDIPDRLGRGEAIAQLELLAKMHNLAVQYSDQNYDDSTVDGFVRKQTDQLVSGIERINIRRRSMQGKRDVARAGKVVASSFHVYGYRFKRTFDDMGKRLSVMMVVEEYEAGIVKKIYVWYVVHGWSLYRVARHLTDQRVPTPRGDGKYWHKSTIAKILANETYTGVWHYGKFDIRQVDDVGKIKTVRSMRDKSEWIAVNVPAIIDREIWKAAQVQLKTRRIRCFKPTKYKYLLRGRIRCGRCNSMMTGLCVTVNRPERKKKYIYTYYHCPKNHIELGEQRCSTMYARTEFVDRKVWDEIREFLKDEKRVFEKLETDRAQVQEANRRIEASIAALEIQNQQAQRKIERWYDLYGDGLMKKDEFTQKKKAVEGEIESRLAEVMELRAKLGDYRIITPEQEAELRVYHAKISMGIDNATFEDKQKYMEWLKIICIFDDSADKIMIIGGLDNRVLSTVSISNPC